MASRTNKESVQLSLTIDGKQAEDTIKALDQQGEKIVRQLMDLEEQGKETTDEYKKLKAEQQDLLKQSNELFAKMKSASEQQQRLAVNEGKSMNQLQREYRQLSAIVKNLSPEHKDFNEQVELLHRKKAKIDEMKKAFGQLRDNTKGLKDDIKQVGLNVGDLVTGGLATGGILAAVDLVQDAGAAVAEMVEQMRDLRIEINQITGATGDELDQQAVRIQSLSTTFELEQRELLLASNAALKEFKETTDTTFESIERGLLTGANVSGEFLDNIREYSPQFAAAGFTLDEFIALNIQASKEGIFSDKGLDVVKEFGLRIREQAKSTKDSMEAAFGKQFTDELFDNINDGSLTTVDALKLVSKEMNNTKIPANQLQAVVADVFGGPGEDAGLRYIQMLEGVEVSTLALIDPTNQYVEAQMAQLAANEELALAQNELTKQLEGTGNSLSVFWSNLKTGAINTLVSVLQFFEQFSATAKGIGAGTKQFFTNIWNTLKSGFIDLEILYHQTSKLNPFGDTNAEIDADIAALRARKAELAAESKSVGMAYREAFLAGLEEVDARKSAAAALKKDPTAGLGKSTGFQGSSQSGLSEEQKKNEEQAQREIIEIQRIGQIEQIQQVAFTEEEKKRIREEGLQHVTDIHNQEKEKVQNLEDYKRRQAEETANRRDQIEKMKIQTALSGFETTIQILSMDEKARKKNAKAIKAFETARVYTNLFAEISGYFKGYSALPFVGQVLAAAQAAFATARAQIAVSNIQKQKFERGGIANGASHAQGGIQLFDTGSNRVVGEMEGGEPYMILSKDTYRNNGRVIDALLHSSQYRGGAPIFANGGLFQPQVIQSQNNLGQSTQRNEELQMALLTEQRQMRQAIEAIPTTLKASVSINTIDDASETLADIKKAASL